MISFGITLLMMLFTIFNELRYGDPSHSIGVLVLYHFVMWLPWFILILTTRVLLDYCRKKHVKSTTINKVIPLLLFIPVGHILNFTYLLALHWFKDAPLNLQYWLNTVGDLNVYFSGIQFLAIYFALVAFDNYVDLQAKNERMMKLEKQNFQFQLENIRHHLNPHFIFNSLNIINSLISLGEQEKATEAVTSVSKLLRDTITNGANLHLLEKELELVDSYLYFLRLRFGEKLLLEQTVSNNALQFPIPCFLLLGLLENATSHSNLKQFRVSIDCQIQDRHLQIQVANEYQKKTENNAHLGTGNIKLKSMLALWYKDEFEFSEEVTNNHYQVRIRLPEKVYSHG